MELGLPMSLVLPQVPSGKVEMTLQELVPHFPPGFLQPTELIASYLPTLVTLPLMDIVMRIPPDLLTLRPDQKDVDASVINMADPFTEEILREQSEAANRKSEPNIIDESQVPATEEFVPRDQSARTFVPPVRTPTGVLPPPRPAPLPMPSELSAMPPAPTVARGDSLPPMPEVVRPPAPSAPALNSNVVTTSGRFPAPQRATSPVSLPPQPAPKLPPAVPDTSGFVIPPAIVDPPALATTVPMPPPPRPALTATTPVRAPGEPSLPQPPNRPPSVPATQPLPPLPKLGVPGVVPEDAEKPAAIVPGKPDAAAGELQRLAALAMAEEVEQVEAKEKPPGDPNATKAIGTKPPTPSLPASQDSFLLPTQQVTLSGRMPTGKSIPAPAAPAPATPPAPVTAPPVEAKSSPEAAPEVSEPPAAEASEPGVAPAPLALNLNSCTASDLRNIPGCTPVLAESIVRYRARIGSFRKIEDLLDVPGMNSSAYSALTGEAPPAGAVTQSLAELLGFPAEQKVSLKDVTDRICCWPDVTGCVLSQSSGLSLVGTVPKGFDREAVVAFAPRMFEAINRSFSEVSGKETNELIIPTTGTSFHIFRSNDLYLIILSRLPQMPDRHARIARMVLSGLSMRAT